MPRPKRIREAGLIRHVMARGNGRMRIFLDDADYRRFLALLAATVEDYDLECWTYCLMPNHYHLALRPTLPNLSAALRQLNGRYAQWWNHRYEHVGHVFQGRFKDQIVEERRYLLVLCRYIAMNPVRSGLAQRPEAWTWSSYAATVGLCSPPEFFSVEPALRLFGHDNQVARARFAEFVLGNGEDGAISDRIRSWERILGDRIFKASIHAQLAGALDNYAFVGAPGPTVPS